MGIDESQHADADAQATIAARAKTLSAELGKLKDSIYDPKVQHKVAEDDLHELTDLHGAVTTNAEIFADLGTQAPTDALLSIEKEVAGELGAKLADYNALLAGDVASYNQAAFNAGAPTIAAGKPIRIAAPPSVD